MAIFTGFECDRCKRTERGDFEAVQLERTKLARVQGRVPAADEMPTLVLCMACARELAAWVGARG